MTCAQDEVQTKTEKEISEGGLAGDGENVLKKDYLQGSATAWAPSTDCLALKPLLPEVARPTGHGIHHTFHIAVRVKNADDMVEIKIKCFLIGSNFIHKLGTSGRGTSKLP